MIISNRRKTRFKIKILILNIFFYLYFLPNRRLKNFFILPNQTNLKNSDLYDVVQELTNKKS